MHEAANDRLLESITQRDKWMLMVVRDDRSCHNVTRPPDPSAILKQDLLNPITKTNIMKSRFTAIVEREGSGYVALCPEVDVASQGDTVAEARENLAEALSLFFETAPPEEINRRLHNEVYVTTVEVAIG